MSRQRCITRNGIHFVAATLFFCAYSLRAQTQPAVAAQPNISALTRPCSANPVLSGSGTRKKTSHKSTNPLPAESAPTCIEVKGQSIEVQEFLQNTARKQAWRIGENRVSEDTWSYVRYLNPDELDRFADTKVLIEPVSFSSGKAAVTVRTSDLGDGYVRLQISTHFQGEGQSTDKASPQPATLWPLNSKGVLERDLVNALQSGYKPLD